MMKSQNTLFLRLILCTFLIVTTRAYADLHPSGGPAGKTNNSAALIAFGDTAFIGSNGYCMRTTDGGKTWVQLSEGLGKFPYRRQPKCFGRIGNTIYMGCQGAATVYTTTDFGDHWTPYATNISPTGITTNAVSSDGRVFMSGNGQMPLMYTTANDTGWTATNLGGIVTAISVIGKDSIWATMGGKTFYSHDNGNTWTQIKHEPLTGFGLGATDFVKAGSRILAVTNGGINATYYSDDYGDTWTLSTKTIMGGGGASFVKFSDDEIYVNGTLTVTTDLISAMFKSTDRGVTWLPAATMVNAFSMARWRGGDEVLITGGGGLYTWHRGDTSAKLVPLPYTTAKSLVKLDEYVYALTQEGYFRRPTSSGDWMLVSDLKRWYGTHLNNLEAYGKALYLSTDSGVFASYADGIFTEVGGPFKGKNVVSYYVSGNTVLAAQSSNGAKTDTIYSSTDAGAHWTAYAVAFGSQPAFQASSFMQHNGKLFVTGNTGNAISTDNGASWTFTNTTVFGYTIATRLYSFGGVLERERFKAGGSGSIGIDQSTDNGTTWTADTVGLAQDFASEPYVNGVFLAEGKLYTYQAKPGSEGLFVKTTPSSSWALMPNTAALPANPTALIANNSDLFIAANGEGVWTTVAASTGQAEQPGITITSSTTLDFGSHASGSTATMNIDVKDTSTLNITDLSLLISGPDASQFSSTSSGFTVNAGQSVSIPITFSPTGASGNRTATAVLNFGGLNGETLSRSVTLNASVASSGVWATAMRPAKLTLSPNPAKGYVHVALANSVGAIHLEIVDPTGRVVLSTIRDDGNIDVRSLNSGVYFLHVTSGNTTEITKLVIE